MKNRIKCLRKSARMTQGQFAEKFNVDQTAVSNWEQYKNSIDIKIAKEIASHFKVPLEFVYGFEFELRKEMNDWREDLQEDVMNEHPDCRDLLIFRYGKGFFQNIDPNMLTFDNAEISSFNEKSYAFKVIKSLKEETDGTTIKEYTGDIISVPCEFLHNRNPEEFYALKVNGDSMYPNLMDGDNVLVFKSSDIDSGNIALFSHNGEEATIRRFIKYVNRAEFIAINPIYAPIVIREKDLKNIKIYGKVYTMIRNYM